MNAQRKRKTVFVLAVVLLCSVVGMISATAKAATTYPHSYTIRNFLSDYQYVVKGDMTLENHTVGGVVAGGNVSLSTFGEAMVMPSYGKNVTKVVDLNATKYDGIPAGYASNTFYYQTMVDGAVPGYLTGSFVQGEFLKVNEAFDSLYSESEQMALTATGTPEKIGNTITVDFSKADNYKLDASLLTKGGNDVVNIIGIHSADDFTRKEYRISFTGINDSTLFFDNMWTSSSSYDYFVRFTLNGNPFEQVMKQISTENYAGGQYVNAGLKFIINLPDAKRLTTNGLSGHLVAPRADLTIDGGALEGGIIAERVNANVQAHFYPYYPVGSPRDNTPADKSLQIIETNVDKTEVLVNQTAIVDTIKDQDGNLVIVNMENADFQWQVKDPVTGQWSDIPGAVTPEFVPGADLDGREIRCRVTGKNGYTGVVYDNSVVCSFSSKGGISKSGKNSTSKNNNKSVELKIPTIVMKKVMGPKMKFKIKLLNLKGAKVSCESTNTKIATISKKGLVKAKKKTGKCRLTINVTKGKHRIQYRVNLVVRKNCKKNYSLYKYKTNYKHPSVSLYKLVPKNKTYKIKLKHVDKKAKVVYKSSNKKVATVNKNGKVIPKRNGRADVTITVAQNGVKYRYFVVVRVTETDKESNTSYLKVIK